MERFAYPTFDKLADKLALVEQVLEEDLALDRRYRVPGSPTFVLVDTVGRQLTRFHFEPTAQALEGRLRPFLA